MKVINVLAIFILGFVNVNAQSGSVLIGGKNRSFHIESGMEASSCTITLTDAVCFDSIAWQKLQKQLQFEDTITDRVFRCPGRQEAYSMNYIAHLPPREGMSIVILDVLRHKYPQARKVIGDKKLIVVIAEDMDGILYYLNISCLNAKTSEMMKGCMVDIIRVLNTVYRFEKPSKYGMYEPVQFSFPIWPKDWDYLISKPSKNK